MSTTSLPSTSSPTWREGTHGRRSTRSAEKASPSSWGARREAWGASGAQPGPTDALRFFNATAVTVDGQDVGGRNFLNGDPTPLFQTTTWTPVSGTVTAGTGFVPNPAGGPWDVSGGLVLSLKVSCGPVDGCAQDVSFDNVTFTIN